MPDLVSILVPVHNRIDLTAACLESLYRCREPNVPAEVIVIDDASTDGTAEFIRARYPDVKLTRNARRQSFGANINAAARQATGRFLCLLNNDTLVRPHWLGPMVDAAAKDPMIGVVGNRQLWPDSNKINHAGMAFDQRCEPVHVHVGQDADFAPALVDREFQVLTAACWVVPKSVFDELGGFDLQFKNGYEDVDFCLRVRDRGLKVWYVGASVIEHYGQSTPGRTANDAENARRFHRKWRGRIRPDFHEFTALAPWRVGNGKHPAPAVTKADTDIHFAVPLATGNSFSWVTAQLATACEDAGMTVSVLPGKLDVSIERDRRAALQKMMRRSPSSKFQIRWNHFWKPYLTQKLNGEINAEIFTVNYRYGRQPIWSLDHWLRHTVVNPYRKLPVSRYCADMLTDLGVRDDACRVVPHGFSPEILADDKIDGRFSGYQFVFLAMTNAHDPLRYGTDILLKSYGQAFAGRKDVVLVLKDYGNAPGDVENWAKSTAEIAPVVYLRDFVSKQALMALYRAADAFVAPFRGEGFGMKIVDACALGIPVIAPLYGGPRDYLQTGSFYPVKFAEIPVGDCLDAEEGVVPPYALWCEPDGADLSDQMIAASLDRGRSRQVGLSATKFVRENYAWRNAASVLAGAFADFSRQRDAAVGARAAVVSKALSVVMPTFRRPVELRKTLAAYETQTQAKNDWEIIVVDDGSGPEFNVGEAVAAFSSRLPIKFVAHASNSGPGRARETAIPLATGDLILFTGDDIVPHRNLVREHLAAHLGLNADKAAVLGYIGWDKDIEVSELMDFITGEGGHQFSYQAMEPYKPVRPEFFYTSNVSLKRDFLTAQETIFQPRFVGYGCEDVELGVRLADQGMTLYFNPDAYGFHNHAMSDEAIYRRQYNVGRALVTYALLHPQRVDDDGTRLLSLFELIQHAAQSGGRDSRAAKTEADSFASIFARLAPTLDDSDDIARRLSEVSQAKSRSVRRLAAAMASDLDATRGRVFRQRLELAQFCGMAEEWFGGSTAVDRYSICEALLRQRLFSARHGAPASLDGASGLEQRVRFVELLRGQHPAAASMLRTVVRLATGVAKRI